MSTSLIDAWMMSGRADLRDGELLLGNGDAFRIEEAAHVVREVTGAGDAHALVGRVRPIWALGALGAEVLDRSMVIGDLAYDVVPGMLGSPIGRPGGTPRSSAAVLATLSELSDRAAAGQSDEDLLARYLIERLE